MVIHGLEGLGWEGWRVVVVQGAWGVEGNPIVPKAHEFPSQWPRASLLLASLALSREALRQAIKNLRLEIICRKVVNNCW